MKYVAVWMIKILLMDHDEESIRNFKTYLRMSFPNIKTVYTLSDQNRDIAHVFNEIMPDLVIADIGFFGMRVVKTMADLSERFPDIKFIVYGTLNESGYLQKLMEYGVID